MKTIVTLVVVFLLGYLAWPYYHVWRLDQAVAADDRAALAEMVDLEAVRDQIRRRLNKEVDSAVGDVSNAFVNWLQDGIRRMGSGAVERMVTLEWVRLQLLAKTPPQAEPHFLDRISHAFFDAPTGFLIRIGELGEDPVHVRLSLQKTAWRVTAVYN